ncbi:MAG: hypothetical protein JWR19_19 [Pedosphaera sp.]|nr:hypothetical protein [Pedosphaera sp.]
MHVMIKNFLSVIFLVCCARVVSATPPEVSPASRESIEWCDIWIAHADQTNLPRVLLIGDSISRDYYPEVANRLAGKAYVARLSTSRFISDPVLLREITMVLADMKFDVIHFNNGMHGWQHTEKEYRQAFPEFLAAIQSQAPEARLIWATTTTLKKSTVPKADHAQASDARIADRNAIALEYIKPHGIAVDDLNALVQGHPEYHSDNVHFNSQGVALEAGQVAEQITRLLSR